MSSENSNFSAFSLVTRLDISIIHFLIFSFPLYRIETSLLRIVLVSTFSFAANQFTIWSKNALAWVSSGIAPLIAYGIECFIIIRLMRLDCSHFSIVDLCSAVLTLVRFEGRSTLNAWSKSIHPSTIITCSFHFLKFVSLSTGMLLTFANIEDVEFIIIKLTISHINIIHT